MNATDVATVRTADFAAISAAAALIREGRLVAFPTETVYGLGADATNGHAVAAIFAAKGRPQFNPLIVHVNNIEQAAEFAEFSSIAHVLGEVFWPGALTLVLPRRQDCRLSLLVSAGLDTVALRAPSHPRRRPAHRGGRRAAGRTERQPLGTGERDQRGPCRRGAGRPDRSHLGRWPGTSWNRIDRDRVRRWKSSAVAAGGRHARSHRENYRAVGQRQAWAVSPPPASSPAIMRPAQRCAWARARPLRAKLFSPSVRRFHAGAGRTLNLSPSGDLAEAAANLFAMLRALDADGAKAIAVMPIPAWGLGEAINDRLRRAAAPRGGAP